MSTLSGWDAVLFECVNGALHPAQGCNSHCGEPPSDMLLPAPWRCRPGRGPGCRHTSPVTARVLRRFPGGHTGLTTHPAEFGELLRKAFRA
ncbi:hypothetical protein Sspor_81400 [Streptomyces spororaveus]|uniref:Uncharacterized protein n=1 Tax=Streptomyces spororaveus TaxID=284039 RepID=A0ABQ3TQ94_9ACTN|nr:hypothetical protein Sspor_81400 [Streptomyces spororaveus]